MIELRPYQEVLIEKCRTEMRNGVRRMLLCSPTGSGKTGVSSYILNKSAQSGNRCIFLVHRVELLHQTVETFRQFGVEAGIIAAGFPENPERPIQVASIPTVLKRLNRIGKFDMVVCDEAAHAPSKTWTSVLNAWPDAWRIGLSATPVRMSGEGFDDLFETLIKGPEVAELIRDGWLAPFRMFAPPGVDPSGLHVRGGDYVPEESQRLVDRPFITGSAIEHYKRLSHGKRAIVFCAGIQHSKNVADQFNAAGIPALHVDGGTVASDRKAALESFRTGEILVLTNAALFVEGVDVPALETCIILRPTYSLSMYLQMIGRALRPSTGKTALILDHVGAVAMHGFPDVVHDWSLYGSTRRQKRVVDETDVKIRTCIECYSCYDPKLNRCPFCDTEYQPTMREIQQREGELAEIQRIEKQKMVRQEQGMARTLSDLIALGEKRGVKNPFFWAKKIYESRNRGKK